MPTQAANEKLHLMRDLVAKLQEKKRKAVTAHPLVYRPWGSFCLLQQENACQTYYQYKLLSMQKHVHRAEQSKDRRKWSLKSSF